MFHRWWKLGDGQYVWGQVVKTLGEEKKKYLSSNGIVRDKKLTQQRIWLAKDL